MTINPIGAPTASQSIDPTSFQTRMQQALAPVAQLFGESSDQLMSELNTGGTSLSALASQKGISQTDLVNAIKQGLQQTSTNNGQSLSDAQLTNIASRIANHKHGGHHHHGGGAAPVAASTDPTATTGSSSTSSTSSTDELLQLLEAQGQTNIDQTF
ncbi:MAG TPA: hypothetical protein VL119_03475 [Acidimicrobiia bacterium]|nr:hypothetical protein [Acidimicrobiia bacterium]